MSSTQIRKLVKTFSSDPKHDLIIKVNSKNIISNLEKSRALMERMERAVRIQKMEMQLKSMRIQRSWV